MLSEDSVRALLKEDSWLKDGNGLGTITQPLGNESSLVPLIRKVEIDSVGFEESPSLHSFLARLYFSSYEELDSQTKKDIELKKLGERRRIKPDSLKHLDDLLVEGVNFEDYFQSKNTESLIRDPNEIFNPGRLRLANAALKINDYISSPNFPRGTANLERAMNLVEDGRKPLSYAEFVEPLISDFSGSMQSDGFLSYLAITSKLAPKVKALEEMYSSQ